MSRLVRRSTAAAAGIAALGAGFAGQALAAPAPAAPAAPEFEAPAAPDASALEDALAQLPAAPGGEVAQLPELFSFEMPAAPQIAAPAQQAPGLDSVGDQGSGGEGPVTFDVGPEPGPGLPNPGSVEFDGMMPDPAENAPAVTVGPMELSGESLSGMMGGLG